MAKSSTTSLRYMGKRTTRKKYKENNMMLKPFGFCCDINDADERTRYGQHRLPFKSSFEILSPIQESPTMKFRFQSIGPELKKPQKQKSKGIKSHPRIWDLSENKNMRSRGPLLWYLEDEIAFAQEIIRSERKRTYDQKMNKYTNIGRRKDYLRYIKLQQIMALGKIITMDYEEMVTFRTQRALSAIGVTSTFVKFPSDIIRNMQRATKLDAINFLREIYRNLTGKYFEEEGHKEDYDCNERITLSAIAMLSLPSTLLELDKRLPPIKKMIIIEGDDTTEKRMNKQHNEMEIGLNRFKIKQNPDDNDDEMMTMIWHHSRNAHKMTPRVVTLPSNAKSPRSTHFRRDKYESPYAEPIIGPSDWAAYRTRLRQWEEKCKDLAKARLFFSLINATIGFGESDNAKIRTDNKNTEHSNVRNRLRNIPVSDETTKYNHSFDFTISGLENEPGPIEYKICGTMKPPFPKRKSWLGEKEAQYIISGIAEDEDPPQCPVTYVMTGVAYVTPKNSDEEFFTELKLGDRPKKIYPRGRKNLSRKWQEWLQEADEQFFEVEKEANKLIKSFEATMRLVMSEGLCDTCCSCRQTRKSNLKWHATKTPHVVIDNVVEAEDRTKYVIGSLAMHSPAPSLAESMSYPMEVVASKDQVEKRLVIDGTTNDSGETTYHVSGIAETIEHLPRSTVLDKRVIDKPLRNVPACACTIEQIFNAGSTLVPSDDDVPQSNKTDPCFGHKYRPKESPGYSCKNYPRHESCRRNPFKNDTLEKLRQQLTEKSNCQECERSVCSGRLEPNERFTLPTFAPCGDEDGMAICAGPWGAVNVPDPRVAAVRKEETRNVLRVSEPRPPKLDSDDDEVAEDEDSENESKKIETNGKQVEEIKAQTSKEARRHKLRAVVTGKSLIDDQSRKNASTACGFERPWDVARTAPTIDPGTGDHESSLDPTPEILSSNANDSNAILVREQASSQEHGSSNLIINTRSNELSKKMVRKTRRKPATRAEKIKSRIRSTSYRSEQKLSRNAKNDRSSDPNRRSTAMGQSLSRTKPRHRLSRSVNRVTKGVAPTTDSNRTGNNKHVRNTNKREQSLHSKGATRNREPDNRRSLGRLEMRKSGTGKKLRKLDKSQDIDVTETSREQLHSMIESSEQPRIASSDVSIEADEKTKDNSASRATSLRPRQRVSDTNFQSRSRPRDEFPSEKKECCATSEFEAEKEGPFGWRTESQQALPRERTIVYLVEPDSRVAMVPVREGGRSCECRENRNKKKMLLYNLGGAVGDVHGEGSKGGPQLIEGVTYVTPPLSPRVSEEYVPEYELSDSPYERFQRKGSTTSSEYVQRPVGSKSSLTRITKNVEPCSCRRESLGVDKSKSITKEDPRRQIYNEDIDGITVDTNSHNPTQNRLSSKMSRWAAIAKDAGLIQYLVRDRSQNDSSSKIRRLKIVKPVCECKYERRVLEREGQKSGRIRGQEHFGSQEKKLQTHDPGISKPMDADSKVTNSSAERISAGIEDVADIRHYVTEVAENSSTGTAMQSSLDQRDVRRSCENSEFCKQTVTSDHRITVKRNRRYRLSKNVPMNSKKRIPSGAIAHIRDESPQIVGGHRNVRKESVLSTPKKTVNSEYKRDMSRNDGISGHGRANDTSVLEDDLDSTGSENDLFNIMKTELQNMADENFIFAKLPDCWMIPQLKAWIEYREGKVHSDFVKKNSLQYSKNAWNLMEKNKQPDIDVPEYNNSIISHPITYDDVYQVKEQVAAMREKFLSDQRKSRVTYARSYWTTMDFYKFPSCNFKQAYFTYLPGKEADGHLFRPWQSDEYKERRYRSCISTIQDNDTSIDE